MAVLKRCKCPNPDTCRAHDWQIWLNLRKGKAGKKPERGSVRNYMHLLPDGAQVPQTRGEALLLEKLVVAWVLQGKPPTRPTVPVVDGDHPVRIAEARLAYETDYLEDLSEGGAGEKSIMKHLVSWPLKTGGTLGELSISALTDHKLARAYLKSVEARTSEARRNRYLSRWSHFLNWCRHEYQKVQPLTGDSPFFHRTLRPAGVERNNEGDGRHRRLLDAEDAALIQTFKDWPDGGMMLGRYYCAIDTMLRQGEMLKLDRKYLKVEKVHGANVYALQVASTTAKSGVSRTIDVTTDRLTEWLETRRARLGRTFGQLDGTPFTASMVRTDWENARVKAGLYTRTRQGSRYTDTPVGEVLHWHDLRHEGASLLLEGGVNIDHIRRILGHTSLKTTQRYLNPKEHGIADAMRKVALALQR